MNQPSAESTLDGDRPARAFSQRTAGTRTLHREPTREADPQFSRWLNKTLHDVFDSVSQEPLPHEMAELVRRLDRMRPDAR